MSDHDNEPKEDALRRYEALKESLGNALSDSHASYANELTFARDVLGYTCYLLDYWLAQAREAYTAGNHDAAYTIEQFRHRLDTAMRGFARDTRDLSI